MVLLYERLCRDHWGQSNEKGHCRRIGGVNSARRRGRASGLVFAAWNSRKPTPRNCCGCGNSCGAGSACRRSNSGGPCSSGSPRLHLGRLLPRTSNSPNSSNSVRAPGACSARALELTSNLQKVAQSRLGNAEQSSPAK